MACIYKKLKQIQLRTTKNTPSLNSARYFTQILTILQDKMGISNIIYMGLRILAIRLNSKTFFFTQTILLFSYLLS